MTVDGRDDRSGSVEQHVTDRDTMAASTLHTAAPIPPAPPETNATRDVIASLPTPASAGPHPRARPRLAATPRSARHRSQDRKGPTPLPAGRHACQNVAMESAPEVTLADGSHATVRRLTAADRDAVRELYRHLSPSARRFRFFTGGASEQVIERYADPGRALTIGVYLGEEGRSVLAGEASLVPTVGGDAEMAIAVRDESSGMGLGTILLDALGAAARAEGITRFVAVVLVDNDAMRRLLRRRGFAVIDHPAPGVVVAAFDPIGGMPSWPAGQRGRVLIEAPGWWERREEQALREAGYDVAVCSGPGRATRSCPLLAGGVCPLVRGAEAVLLGFPRESDECAELLANHRRADLPVLLVGTGAGHPPAGSEPRVAWGDESRVAELLAERGVLAAAHASGPPGATEAAPGGRHRQGEAPATHDGATTS